MQNKLICYKTFQAVANLPFVMLRLKIPLQAVPASTLALITLVLNLARGKHNPFQFVNVCFNKQKKTLRFWVIQDFAISYSTACSSSNQSSAKEAGSEVDNLR